jgi:hypothetical protein
VINEIISGVCEKLREEFGEELKIYDENTARKKGVLDSNKPLREPYFYVSCRNPTASKRVKDRYFTQVQLLGNRYLRSVALCVECRWFENWGEVLDRLFDCLEYVPLGDSVVRGSSMQGEHTDDVLNFFVCYDVFVYLEESKVKMGHLERLFHLNEQ